MKATICYRRDGTESYSLDGRECTKEEFDAALPAKDLGAAPSAGGLVGWPCESEAMAIPPWQIKEAMEKDKRIGAPVTEYNKETGAPILTSPGHHHQYRRAHGYRHKGSFTE